jgi:hypothetical protein
MEKPEMKALLEAVLASDDKFKRGWAFAQAIVKLGPVEELEMAREIIDADDNLRERAAEDSFDDIQYETGLRQKWSSELPSVDQALARHPRVAERAKGVGYKVALLAFSEFCSCDVNYACEVLEEVIKEFDSGASKVERRCGMYGSGRWPRNHYASVLAAMAIFTQRPCWVLRHLFLPEVTSSGMHGFDSMVFERK